jgi:hypothetical protein
MRSFEESSRKDAKNAKKTEEQFLASVFFAFFASLRELSGSPPLHTIMMEEEAQ